MLAHFPEANTYQLSLLGRAPRPKELRQVRMRSAPIGVQYLFGLWGEEKSSHDPIKWRKNQDFLEVYETRAGGICEKGNQCCSG